MSEFFGTISMGLKFPIIKQGDDIANITVNTVKKVYESGAITPRQRDVICITESMVARAQGNFANVEDIAGDVEEKLGGGHIGVVFPIMSRNRFSMILNAIAKAADEVTLLLSYPSDEVGNRLISDESLAEKGVDLFNDVFEKDEFEKLFPDTKHEFTGVNYIDFYDEIIKNSGAKSRIILANNPEKILDYTKNIIAADIHSRKTTKERLKKAGAKKVLGLDDILNNKSDSHGYNEDYGLLGSNKATEDSLKLFPRDCKALCEKIQKEISTIAGKNIEVMVYGDGAFKDPVGKIWELADPIVSPGHTKGLEGRPNEIKIKYVADSEFSHLSGEELDEAIKERIRSKESDLKGNMTSEGTTPRQLTDLLGSLADLTSGSGDKGTPVIYIQGYFDNYSS